MSPYGHCGVMAGSRKKLFRAGFTLVSFATKSSGYQAYWVSFELDQSLVAILYINITISQKMGTFLINEPFHD